MSTNYESSLSVTSTHSQTIRSALAQSSQASRAGSDAPQTSQTSQDLQPDRVTLSEEALRKAGLLKDQPATPKTGAPAQKDTSNPQKTSSSPNDSQSRELESLKQTDREVRAHEQAHVAAGGGLVRGAASFGYASGSDGKLYAISGEVSIDTSPVPDNPDATVQKMMQVTRAALAPAQPSGQDRAVASAATKMEGQARQEAALNITQKAQTKDTSTPPAKRVNLQA